MFKYALYIIIINRNVLFNAIITCMNKYIIIIKGQYIDSQDSECHFH